MRYLALLLCACAGDDITRCGARVVGTDAPSVEHIEVVAGRAFLHSPDVRLHAVCSAMRGWTVVAEREVHVPADVPGQAVEGMTVGGYAHAHEVHVTLNLGALAHEMAHVAQGLDDDSVGHVGWDSDVFPQLQLVAMGQCEDSCP